VINGKKVPILRCNRGLFFSTYILISRTITTITKIKKIALKYSIFKGISIHLLIRKLNIADIIKTIVVDPATLIAISILFDEPTKGQSPMH
jgi:hypothetical protein